LPVGGSPVARSWPPPALPPIPPGRPPPPRAGRGAGRAARDAPPGRYPPRGAGRGGDGRARPSGPEAGPARPRGPEPPAPRGPRAAGRRAAPGGAPAAGLGRCDAFGWPPLPEIEFVARAWPDAAGRVPPVYRSAGLQEASRHLSDLAGSRRVRQTIHVQRETL